MEKNIDHNLYDICKCKLISKEMKIHLIENGMLPLVIKHIHLFE